MRVFLFSCVLVLAAAAAASAQVVNSYTPAPGTGATVYVPVGGSTPAPFTRLRAPADISTAAPPLLAPGAVRAVAAPGAISMRAGDSNLAHTAASTAAFSPGNGWVAREDDSEALRPSESVLAARPAAGQSIRYYDAQARVVANSPVVGGTVARYGTASPAPQVVPAAIIQPLGGTAPSYPVTQAQYLAPAAVTPTIVAGQAPSAVAACPPAMAAPAYGNYAAYPVESSWRPVIDFGQSRSGVYLGRGLIGQPKAYVDGQPVRNFFRYVLP